MRDALTFNLVFVSWPLENDSSEQLFIFSVSLIIHKFKRWGCQINQLFYYYYFADQNKPAVKSTDRNYVLCVGVVDAKKKRAKLLFYPSFCVIFLKRPHFWSIIFLSPHISKSVQFNLFIQIRELNRDFFTLDILGTFKRMW